MMKMLFEMVAICGDQVRVILDDEEVLGVALLGGLGEVEGTGEHGLAVDEDDLVVGDRVLVVDEDGDVVVEEERRRAVVGGAVGLVEDDADLYSARCGVAQ